MKVKLSKVGYASLAIIIFYMIVAGITPFLPLHDPMYDFAPPEDITFNYTRPIIYKNVFFADKDTGEFVVYSKQNS